MSRKKRGALAVAAALSLALLAGASFAACGGSGKDSGVATPASATPSGLGVIEDRSLGFLIHYPSQWTGENSVESNLIYYSKQDQWQFHTYVRESQPTTFVGESLALFVRVVTTRSEQGKAAIADYFVSLHSLSADSQTLFYDVTGNSNQSMRRLAEVSIGGQPAVLVESTMPPGHRGEPFNVRAYYVQWNQNLFVIGFVGPTLQQLQDDEPIIDSIVSSSQFVRPGG